MQWYFKDTPKTTDGKTQYYHSKWPKKPWYYHSTFPQIIWYYHGRCPKNMVLPKQLPKKHGITMVTAPKKWF